MWKCFKNEKLWCAIGGAAALVIGKKIVTAETTRKLAVSGLAKGMKLLQLDYLGGHGSRGSGRVSFKNFRLTCVECGADTAALCGLFGEVEEYELFSL